MEWKHETLAYRINDRKEELDLDAIHAMLQTSYWAANRTKQTIAAAIEGSLCFGLHGEAGQVGFMRVITDGVTFSYICDVIVHCDHRGRGLGKWMMRYLLEHPALLGTNMMLATIDAHGLYEQFGFTRNEAMRKPASPVS